MRIIETIFDLRTSIQTAKQAGQRIGYVPTMGFLHDGHMALVDRARAENQFVVASVFVNPLQFGPNEDFAAYPRKIHQDATLLEQHGCDILFAPSVSTMYPAQENTVVHVQGLSERLCGQSRPTHFRGVTTVVMKFFNIVQPNAAYFGQKDGQQLVIIKQMVQDLNIPIEIVGVPIVRESDGLAKSSRNIYLTEAQRTHATILFRTLQWAKAKIAAGERNAEQLRTEMQNQLTHEPDVLLDYIEIVNQNTLQPVSAIEGDIMIAIAAYIGKARLIDNLQLHMNHEFC